MSSQLPDHYIYHIHLIYDKEPVPGWQDIRRTVDVHSLYWIVSGRGAFEKADGVIEVGQDTMLYLRPGVQLQMVSDHEQPLHIKMLQFDVLRIGYEKYKPPVTELVGNLPLPFLQRFLPEQASLIHRRIRMISEAPGQPELQYEFALLLAELADRSKTQDVREEACASIRKWLEMHYASEISMEQLASTFGVSSSYLRKWFIQELGVPPKVYLNHIRNEQAKKYLTMTSEPMKMIANACGFADEYHFGKMFKQWNRTAPGSYRRMSKAAVETRGTV